MAPPEEVGVVFHGPLQVIADHRYLGYFQFPTENPLSDDVWARFRHYLLPPVLSYRAGLPRWPHGPFVTSPPALLLLKGG